MGYKDKERKRAYQREWIAKRKEPIDDFKKTLCCARCGFSDYRALVFHHLDSSKKEFAVSRKRWTPLEKLMEEIEKCEVLCANCHSIEHFKDKRT